MRAPPPPNEAARLAALRGAELLDTPPEREFDDTARLAAQICGTPIALVSLVDEHRQWFKARVGLGAAETPRDVSFCAHALLRPDEPLVVPDAAADARFADNQLVLAEPHIRFYAGVPLVTGEGHALGTLCVIDRRPRELSPDQLDALRALARHVQTLLELRRHGRLLRAEIAERRRVEQERERLIAELQAALAEVRTLGDLLPMCGWCRKIRDDRGYWDSVESYFKKHAAVEFTHGICPDCTAKMMAEISALPGAGPG